jgi:hypothetical protein
MVSQHFMESKGSLPHSQELSTCPYPEPNTTTPPHPISARSILMLSTHLRFCLYSGLFPSGFLTSNLYVPLLHHSHYMSRPPHPLWLDNPNYTWRRVQIMQLLVMQFSPPFRHFIPLRSKYSLSTLFWNTLSLCFSCKARYQVSHSYRTTCKIILVYILIFKIFGSKRVEKRFRTEW